MNIWLLGFSVILLCIIIFVVLKVKTLKRRNINLQDELKFFKKEKEYYNEAILLFSKEQEILFANQSAKKLLTLVGEIQDYAMNQEVYIETQNGIKGKFFDVLEQAINKEQSTFELHNVIFSVGSKELYVNIFVDKSLWNIDGTMTCVLDMQSVKSDLYTAIDKKGHIDFLTGLPSEFVALEEIDTLILENRKVLKPFGLFLLGIDNFKTIQMNLGLGYSHQIVKQIGYYFIQHPHQNISTYCIDSDKFLFVVKNIEVEEDIQKFSRALIDSINILNTEYDDLRLTSSIGIALYPEEGKNAQKLLDNAYIALEDAHLRGDSSIQVFSHKGYLGQVNHLNIDTKNKKIFIKEDFELYYEPVFDLKGEKIIALESLLRWNHPQYGLMSFDEFLKMASGTGCMIDVGEYVFLEVIRERQRCMKYVSDDFKISINLSLKEIDIEVLIPRIQRFFEKYQVEKRMISWDIDEKEALENIEETAVKLKLLQGFGLSLSLDNFGNKYTSLKYLSLFPIDTVKIDRSLIFELTLANSSELLVQAMIEMAHTLGYKVVAEGVETSKEVRVLNRLNCDYAQGYLYSRPLNSKALDKLLE